MKVTDVRTILVSRVEPTIVDSHPRLLADPDLRLHPTQPGRCFDEVYQRSPWWGPGGFALNVLSGIEMALWDLAGMGAPNARPRAPWVVRRTAGCRSIPLAGRPAPPVQTTVNQAVRPVGLGFKGPRLGTGMIGRHEFIEMNPFQPGIVEYARYARRT